MASIEYRVRQSRVIAAPSCTKRRSQGWAQESRKVHAQCRKSCLMHRTCKKATTNANQERIASLATLSLTAGGMGVPTTDTGCIVEHNRKRCFGGRRNTVGKIGGQQQI